MRCFQWISAAVARHPAENEHLATPFRYCRFRGDSRASRFRGAKAQRMTSVAQIEIELSDDLARPRLPEGAQERLTTLLDNQDGGRTHGGLRTAERRVLVDLPGLLSLLNLRTERISYSAKL